MPDGSDRPQGQRVCDVPWHHLNTPQFYEIIWPQIASFIDAALKRDPLERFSVQDVLQQILNGRLRLWVSYDQQKHEFEMAAVTEVIQWPQCRELKIWLGGGKNLKMWKDEFVNMIEGYARAEGCQYLTGGGRIGWTRVVPGWHQVGIEIAKKL